MIVVANKYVAIRQDHVEHIVATRPLVSSIK